MHCVACSWLHDVLSKSIAQVQKKVLWKWARWEQGKPCTRSSKWGVTAKQLFLLPFHSFLTTDFLLPPIPGGQGIGREVLHHVAAAHKAGMASKQKLCSRLGWGASMALEAEDVRCRGTDMGRVFTMVIFMGRDGSGSLLKGTSPLPRCRTRGHRRQCEQPTQRRRWHPSHYETPHLGSGFYLAGVEAINRLDQLPGLATHLAPLLGRCQAHKQRGYGTALLLPTSPLLLSSQQLCMKIMIIYMKLSEPILHEIPLSLGQYLSFYCIFSVLFFF